MCPKYCMGHTYTKKLFVICLKFEFNWASCILPGNAVAHISWFFSRDGHLSLCLASLWEMLLHTGQTFVFLLTYSPHQAQKLLGKCCLYGVDINCYPQERLRAVSAELGPGSFLSRSWMLWRKDMKSSWVPLSSTLIPTPALAAYS